jgi:hypothetical protein
MIESCDSDENLAYFHGFDAGIGLLCAKAGLSDPSLAQGLRQLADKMAEETAEALRFLMHEDSYIIITQTLYRT